jgi:hypothetical protein
MCQRRRSLELVRHETQPKQPPSHASQAVVNNLQTLGSGLSAFQIGKAQSPVPDGGGVAGFIPEIPVSKGLTESNPWAIPVDPWRGCPLGRSVVLKDLRGRSVEISQIVKERRYQNGPSTGPGPGRIARWGMRFGDGGYASTCRASLTEFGARKGAKIVKCPLDNHFGLDDTEVVASL